MNLNEKALLNIEEMMRYTGLGESTIRNMLRDPENSFSVRVGNRWYANRRKFDNWLDQQTLI